eukprot:m.355 g.355  ORF g.355 m.355 type:complete len:215 (-) comp166_c0_seq2:273-917(-)
MNGPRVAYRYDFRAPAKVNEGDEIFISYGDYKATYQYLISYGFAPEVDAGDFIVLTLAESTTATLRMIQAEDSATGFPTVLRKALEGSGTPSSLSGLVGSDGRVPDVFMRVLEAACSVSASTDTAVGALTAAVTAAVDRFPTTLSEDERALADKAGMYDEESVALDVRVRFKRTFRALQDALAHLVQHGEWSGERHNRSLVLCRSSHQSWHPLA